jgi:hypothetical protein
MKYMLLIHSGAIDADPPAMSASGKGRIRGHRRDTSQWI